MKTVTLAITGASGVIYGWNLLEHLNRNETVGQIFLIVSTAGQQVSREELHRSLPEMSTRITTILPKTTWLDENNLGAPVASGSYPVDAMVVAPCTMATAGCIASGAGRNLIHRAADVMLKEKRPLILVPRETPLSVIHLENFLVLSRAGATIFPAMPSFYHQPETIEDMVDAFSNRLLMHLDLPSDNSRIWQGWS